MEEGLSEFRIALGLGVVSLLTIMNETLFGFVFLSFLVC